MPARGDGSLGYGVGSVQGCGVRVNRMRRMEKIFKTYTLIDTDFDQIV